MEFSLFAPYNEFVALIGSWNQWQPIDMKKGDDGWWRVDVPLKDGEHQYKFQVKSKSYFAEGKILSVADPYSTRVTRDSDENSIIVIKDGKRVVTTYQWKHDQVPLPQNPQLVIYEMHIGDFCGGPGDVKEGTPGTFEEAAAKLDYLSSLGVNAVELMPITEYPGDQSWGYNPRILFGVENNYGTPDDLCAFVDECHARGIRVILDKVLNHAEMESPLTKIDYTYWYHRENPDAPHLQWGPKYNFGFHDEKLNVWPARQYVRDSLLFWLEHFHVDGIRFDATAVINNYEILGWLHHEVFSFLGGIKPFITIAEHVPQDPTVAGSDGPLDAAWHETFSKQIMATIVGREQDGRQPYNLDAIISTLDPRLEGFESPLNVINYIDNHDQNRIMWQLGQANIFDDAAFRRIKMGASILLTAPGIPMIWMGQEFGESDRKTIERQPIDWSLLQNHSNTDLRNTYAGLIHLRKTMPALHGDSFEVICANPERSFFAYKRWNAEGNVVVVVVNLHDSYLGQVEIASWPEDGVWHEYTDDYDIEVQGGILRDSLAESEVKIYFKK